MSDIEGKVTRVGARMEPRGREQHRWANREVEWAGAHESKRGQRTSFNRANGISDIEGKAAR